MENMRRRRLIPYSICRADWAAHHKR